MNSTEFKSRFFTPYIGSKYEDGINGKKLLIIGASFNCDITKCPYFKECTDENKKDSRDFEHKCIVYQKRKDEKSKLLSNMPSNEIESFLDGDTIYRSYCNFTRFMCESLNRNNSANNFQWDKANFWDHVAFTNYIQFVLSHTYTKPNNVNANNNFPALQETIKELKPDVLCVWGNKINKKIENGLGCDMIEPETYGSFLFDEHKIWYFNPYHPSSGYFWREAKLYQGIVDEIFK